MPGIPCTIRPATPADFPAIYELFCEEIEKGETYAYTLEETTEDWAFQWWMGLKHYCYVAELGEEGSGYGPIGEDGAKNAPHPTSPRRGEEPSGVSRAEGIVKKFAGTCVIRPVKPGRGDHVGNMSFLISPFARGKGVGKALGNFALAEAKRLGFQAMQYNYVVSSNEAAVNLWRSLGFQIIGTVPDAFRHASGALVAIHIMHRYL